MNQTPVDIRGVQDPSASGRLTTYEAVPTRMGVRAGWIPPKRVQRSSSV